MVKHNIIQHAATDSICYRILEIKQKSYLIPRISLLRAQSFLIMGTVSKIYLKSHEKGYLTKCIFSISLVFISVRGGETRRNLEKNKNQSHSGKFLSLIGQKCWQTMGFVSHSPPRFFLPVRLCWCLAFYVSSNVEQFFETPCCVW